MFHGVESLKLQYKGTQGYLKAVEKQQIIQWIRAQSYLRLSDLQKYLKKQYDVVFDILQSNYNLLKEAGITWEKLSHINLSKNDELVKGKKSQGGTIGQIATHQWKPNSLQRLWFRNVIYYGFIS